MQRTSAVLGSALFFVVTPCVMAGVIPLVTHWEFRSAFLRLKLTRGAGVLLVMAGVPGLVNSSPPASHQEHGVLDGALLQVVEHLVAGRAAARPRCCSSSSRSPTSKLLTPQERILPSRRAPRRRRRFPPAGASPASAEVAVEAVRPEPAQRRSQAARVPRREALCGSTFETRKTSSRRPAIASPTTASARPEPYISAVSMWVMPRSRPRRSAATAAARGACSRYQVPWPMTATWRSVDPNASRLILSPSDGVLQSASNAAIDRPKR